MSPEQGFEPRAAGWEARMLPLCYTAPYEMIKVQTVDVFLLSPHDDVIAVDLLHLGLRLHFPGLGRPRDLHFVDAVEDLDTRASARPC